MQSYMSSVAVTNCFCNIVFFLPENFVGEFIVFSSIKMLFFMSSM